MGRQFVNVMLVAVALLSACTLSETPAPPLQGPSELGLSLTTFANPDVLSQDGASQSLIVVQAYDANGQPKRDVAFRAEIMILDPGADGRVGTADDVLRPTDFGSLSARTLVTGNDGRATVTYTAPPPPLVSVDTNSSVTIRLTPSEGNFADARPRFVQIRLVPPGVIIGTTGPTPAFTVTPASPSAFTNVTFDASTSTPGANTIIISYGWNFGDGSTGSGVTAVHQFGPGSYVVTLTVTDSNGVSASRTQSVSVGAGALPTADFAFSPSAPMINQDIFFNAALSRPATGRTIVRYDWDFGSGAPRSGVTVTKSYDVPATYTVVLTVTDDVGQTGTRTQTVTVASTGAAINASFTFSPTNPGSGTTVYFNASASTPQGQLTNYAWDFGDGSTSPTNSGPTTSHAYVVTAARTFVVRLTITDTAGRTATSTQNVPVSFP